MVVSHHSEAQYQQHVISVPQIPHSNPTFAVLMAERFCIITPITKWYVKSNTYHRSWQQTNHFFEKGLDYLKLVVWTDHF
jgi:hypothetical protein